MQKNTVTLFGELLLRLDTPDHQRLEQADSLQVSYTGGEANVAVALSQWGVESSIVSAVPENALGKACLNHFRRYGVNTDSVVRTGDRLGTLYVAKGAGQRGTRVTYDREATSFRKIQPEDIDWQRVLVNCSWFHFTGTALVSPSTRNTLIAGLKIARELEIPTSFDVSYRSTLWSVAEATKAFQEVISNADLLIGSELDVSTFFGVTQTGDQALQDLHQKLGLKWTAFTDRRSDEFGRNFYSAKFFDGETIFKSDEQQTFNVDRIGTGDAFAAGLIYCLLNKSPDKYSVDFATAAAVLKHTISGDFALLSRSEIDVFVQGNAKGKISR